MKKYISIVLAVFIVLLSIAGLAEAGNMCKRGNIRACRPKVYPRASVTVTPVPPSETPVQNQPQSDNYAIEPDVHATWAAANCAAGTWQDGVLNCLATVAPTWTPGVGYPPAYP